MQIKNQLPAAQPGNKAGENQKVGHVMDMYDVKVLFKFQLREFGGEKEKGNQVFEDIPDFATAPPLEVDAMNFYTIDTLGWWIVRVLQAENGHLMPRNYQRFSITDDAGVAEIIGVNNHPNAFLCGHQFIFRRLAKTRL